MSIRVLNPDAFKARLRTFRFAERQIGVVHEHGQLQIKRSEVDDMERELVNNYETLYLDWVLGGRASK